MMLYLATHPAMGGKINNKSQNISSVQNDSHRNMAMKSDIGDLLVIAKYMRKAKSTESPQSSVVIYERTKPEKALKQCV